MAGIFRRNFWLVSLSLPLAAAMPLYGQVQWTQPTAAELKMTSEAKAPGADAIYLNYDDDLNVPEHFEQVYAAIKVLTADGRGYGDIHIY